MIRNGPSPSVLNEGLHIEKGMCACMCSKSLQSILWTVPRQCFCLWDSPGNSTRVGCHALLQGIFPTQRSNLGLLHCRQILHYLSYQTNSVSMQQ